MLSDLWNQGQQGVRLRTRQLSAIQAVEVMDAGASYNPDAHQHQVRPLTQLQDIHHRVALQMVRSRTQQLSAIPAGVIIDALLALTRGGMSTILWFHHRHNLTSEPGR